MTHSQMRMRFLVEACKALSRARRAAGLSEAELAAQAGISVETVTRIEAGNLDACSFGEFVDLVLACDHMPLDLTLAPAECVGAFVGEVPDGQRGAVPFDAWQARREVRRALEASRADGRTSKARR